MVDVDLQWLRSAKKPNHAKTNTKLRMIDLFAGCGGITAGIEAACLELGIDLESVIAWDIFEHATDVFKSNFPEAEIYSVPIENLIDGERGQPPTENEMKFIESVGKIDLIVGGPPCQGNSNLNNHTRGTDPRNLLYLRMARMIEILKPTTCNHRECCRCKKSKTKCCGRDWELVRIIRLFSS